MSCLSPARVHCSARWGVAACLMLMASGCAAVKQARASEESTPAPENGRVLECKEGYAVYYSRSLNGCRTSNGGRLDNSKMTAAHGTYPFGTILRVTRVKRGTCVEVCVTDRLPGTKTNRRLGIIIDVTRAAAAKLDMIIA